MKMAKSTVLIPALVAALLVVTAIISQEHIARSYEKTIGVFLNPRNKQEVVGYTKIAVAEGQMFSPSPDAYSALINLKEAMNTYTKIETEVAERITLSSPDLLTLPIIFLMTNDNADLTPAEAENLQEYIRRGGFIVADDKLLTLAYDSGGNATGSTEGRGGKALRELIQRAVPNARFAPLMNSNPLYHSFFDFNDGPPQGTQNDPASTPTISTTPGSNTSIGSFQKEQYFIEGVSYQGRLAAIYSPMGYTQSWKSMGNLPQLRLGINMIVFALTQEGGIAQIY